MKKYFVTLFFCLPLLSLGQSLTPSVVASYGKWSDNGGFTLSATSGEMMVQTFTGGSHILTQGFQQPDEKSIGVQELFSGDLDVKVFPNPAIDQLFILIQSKNAQSFGVQLFDVLGRELALPGILESGSFQIQYTVNLSGLPAATYFVSVLSPEGKRIHTFKIQKISF